MFKELQPLLEGLTVIITAAKTSDGSLTVTVYPSRNSDKDEPPVAMTPLCVSGSAEELDHELPELLTGYVETIGGFRSNLAAIKAQVAEAAENTRLAQAAKATKKNAPATPKATPAVAPAAPAPLRADLFATSMPPAEAPAEVAAVPAPAAPPSDPRVVAPPAVVPPAAAAPAKKSRGGATPIRGRVVAAAPLPDPSDAPAVVLVAAAAETISIASEEEDEPVIAPPAPVPLVATNISSDLNWADDDTAPEPIVDSGVPAADEDDECPF
jgi:PRTRC genetic system protein E